MVKNLKEFKATHVDGAAGTAFVPGAGENAPTAKPRRADNMKNKEGHMKQGSSDVKSGLETGNQAPGKVSKRRADKDGGKEGVMKQGSSNVKSGLEGGSGPGSMGNDGEGHMMQGSSGVKSGLEPAQYAHEEKLAAIMDQMAELDEEEVDEIYASLLEDGEIDDEDDLYEEEEVELPDPFERVKLTMEDVGDIDFGKIFEGSELTEDFKSKASTIFEGAVVQAVNNRLDEALDKLEDVYAHEISQIKSELVENLDGYLEVVVDDWADENEVDIQNGVTSGIMEDFIAGLKTLFAEHYIEIPEEKIDVVEELEDRMVELEERLDEATNNNIELTEAIETFMKEGVIVDVVEGMTDMDAEKIRSFAENIEYENDEDFHEKLLMMKENYFPGGSGSSTSEYLDEEFSTLQVEDDVDLENSPMKRYAREIGKQTSRISRPFSVKN